MSYVYSNELMHDWRHVCVYICMSVLCLRGGYMFLCYVSRMSFFLPICRFNQLRKTFSKLYYRNLSLISKYKCNLKYILQQGISHPEFYGDMIYKRRKILGHVHFENIFYKRIKSFLKKKLWQLYCNALHVYLSIPLQSIDTLFYLVVRWQTGFSTTWWCIFKP